MRVLRFILGDQLTHTISALRDIGPDDVVLMAEVAEEASYVPHHPQKIAFLFSAMRHFADDLRGRGITVDYVELHADGNTGSLTGELLRAVRRHAADAVVATEPGEWRVEAMMGTWAEAAGVPVEIRTDDRFLCSRPQFAAWAADRASLRLEWFYRAMREKTGLLMEDGKPAGGRWNFDAENRKPLPARHTVPERRRFVPDALTRDVIELVRRRFGNNFGDLEPFGWAVTRAEALQALADFVTNFLPSFGDYQDAMKTGEGFLYHGVISPYLNAGLLTAEEVCQAAVAAYAADAAPLNAVEGFLRQVLGWREFIRGVYWLKMPGYEKTNALGASRPLPAFYWTGDTDMNCLRQAIGDTRRQAYAHHIQRLMVTGNFALLAGVRPAEIEEWYLAVYADAYDWVELPNVHGMVMFADGGLMSSKPYVAGGNYIDRMSDYCDACRYDVKLKSGVGACPFNYLYWAFLIDNAPSLQGNHRLGNQYRTLERFGPERRAALQAEAHAFLDALPSDY
ncbi:cryptochrome/photolyase family protein [Lichenihabitans sp. Uapishka_5]|uniref:cryptochrome/photolyase family protein n=1 Tax=Lichenihabitans sp. Uapishka_5 TaxID=3037302 RepID=UPI0029E7DB18|nr:cryptochrome/photolyase family protein [Lichenihabitans sp. Uapishka_5]MDX7950872.1 cryptochrome/photolyase family protein [Lichenihabitans sp. Uapishka_5]